MQRSKLHGLLCNFIKQSGYVRGYLPELLSHAVPYTGTIPGSKGGWGKLALISTIAAGAYFLYNKYKKNKKKEETDDDKNYSTVPKSVLPPGPPTSLMDWDQNYSWGADDESDYEYNIPPAIPADARYNGIASDTLDPDNIKISSAKIDKIKQWLYK